MPSGCLASALLVVNNLRDIPTDAASGKKTLAVRLGDARTRWLYAGLLVGAFVAGVACAAWRLGRRRLPRSPCPSAVVPDPAGAGGRPRPRADRRARSATGRIQLVFGGAFSLGLWLTADRALTGGCPCATCVQSA